MSRERSETLEIKVTANLTQKSKTHQGETTTYVPLIETNTHHEGRSIGGEHERTTSFSLREQVIRSFAGEEEETTSSSICQELIPLECVEQEVHRGAMVDCCHPTLTSGFSYPPHMTVIPDQDEPPNVNLSDIQLNQLNLLEVVKNHLEIFQQYRICGQDSLPRLQHFANQDDTSFLLNRVFGSDQAHFNAIVEAQNASATNEDVLPHIDSLKLTRQKAVVPIRGVHVSSLCSSEEPVTAWDRESLRIFEQLTKN